jgi:hypothetical protein
MINKNLLGSDDLNREVCEWAQKTLGSLGYALIRHEPEIIQHTPYSYVVRFETSSGNIYLKHTPALLAFESKIIQVLHGQFKASVPIVIAHSIKLNCFLMKDAGRTLRSILKKQFDINLLCNAIKNFTSLQLAVTDDVDVLIDINVPDWRLDKMPDLYRQVITEKAFLIEDGLSEKEVKILESLYPNVLSLCQRLSAYSIKSTIVQPDFNDNNTLIDENLKIITTIDLGEIVISHPFFSLVNFLYVLRKHYPIIRNDDMYYLIKDSYIKNYMACDAEQNLLDAFEIADTLWFAYWLLASHRLMEACGKENYMSFQRGKLTVLLKQFIVKCFEERS